MSNRDVEKSVVEEIKKSFSRFERNVNNAVKNAIMIGGLLQKQKDNLRHGEFLSWLHEHIKELMPGISERTARRWMQLYRKQDQIKLATVANLKEAYKLLEAPNTESYEEEEEKSEERTKKTASKSKQKKQSRAKKPKTEWGFDEYRNKILERLQDLTSMCRKYVRYVNNHEGKTLTISDEWIQKIGSIISAIHELWRIMEMAYIDWNKAIEDELIECIDEDNEIIVEGPEVVHPDDQENTEGNNNYDLDDLDEFYKEEVVAGNRS